MNQAVPQTDQRIGPRGSGGARAPGFWVAAICALLGAGLIASAALAVIATHRQTLAQHSDDLARLSLAIATDVHRIIFAADLQISNVEERLLAAAVQPQSSFEQYVKTPAMHALLRDLITVAPDLEALTILNSSGDLISSSRSWPPPQANVADRNYFIALRDNPERGYVVSEPRKNRVTGQEVIFLAHRINGPDGAFLGVVVGTIASSRFEKLFASLLPSDHASISLYRRDGVLLSRQPPGDYSGAPDPQIQSFIEQTIAGAEGGVTRTTAGVRGDSPQIVALHTVLGYPLVITVTNPEDVVLSSWRQLGWLIFVATASEILLLSVGGYLLVRQFAMRAQIEEVRAKQELTERARAVAEIAERIQARARDELRAVMDHAGDGLILVDQSGTILSLSKPAESIFGYPADEAIGGNVNMLMAGPDRFTVDEAPRAARDATGPALAGPAREFVGRRKDGSLFPLELTVGELLPDNGGPRLVLTARDVTERQAAQEQLRQSQKMDAIGQLTGGIAHDFNNILTVIIGMIEILGKAVAGQPELSGIAKMIDEAATRGADLTQQLLAFSRKQPLEPRDVDVNDLIKKTVALLRPTLGEHIEIEALLEHDAWRALVDPSHLSTALLNLALNARDAMVDGGKLTFESGNVVLDETYAKTNPDVEPGAYVMIAVTDNGIGIPADVLGRVIEPFFTTKEPGKGTGLGLSMVYGFVKQSHGHMKIYSEEGHGTTVKVYLPRSGQASSAPLAGMDAEALAGGHETILVVEDDAMVRNYVLMQLESLGYRTLPACNAIEALSIVATGAPFDLLFTDLIMPGGTNGRQLAEEIQKRRPAVKVLFSSGYTQNAIVHHGRLDPGVNLLVKPYRKSDLARKIRQVLAAQ